MSTYFLAVLELDEPKTQNFISITEVYSYVALIDVATRCLNARTISALFHHHASAHHESRDPRSSDALKCTDLLHASK